MARLFGVARNTIRDNLKRARAAGLTWPLSDDLTSDFLEQSLFARTGTKAGFRRRPQPDWALLAREMKRLGVNLFIARAAERLCCGRSYCPHGIDILRASAPKECD